MDFLTELSLALLLPSIVALLVWCGMILREGETDSPTE
jgi:hypothetical protein